MHTCNLYEKFRYLDLEVTEVDGGILLHKLEISCDLRSIITQAQSADMDLQRRVGYPEFFVASDEDYTLIQFSRFIQGLPRFEERLLVAWHENQDCGICSKMYCVPASNDHTLIQF